MEDPTSTSPGSIMPRYPWLLTRKLDTSTTAAKIRAMRRLGVPYPIAYADEAKADLEKQAEKIAASLRSTGVADAQADREIIALIAYLQRLGTDVRTDIVREDAP
jgi:cytochrome c oxidase cbb3-type subunit I/II